MIAAGDNLGSAFELYTKVVRNPLSNTFPRASTLSPANVAAAVLVAPAQNIADIGPSLGMRALVASLRDPNTSRHAIITIALLAIGIVPLVAVAWAAVRRRDFAVPLALLGILVLPVVRNQQSGYVKFFVLLPVLLAVGATFLRPAVTASFAVVLALLNGLSFGQEIHAGRGAGGDHASFYASFSPQACFVTSGWAAPDGQNWHGTTCAALSKLFDDGPDPNASVPEILRGNAERYAACLDGCFCRADAVLTDDMTAPLKGQVSFVLDHFQVQDVTLDPLLLRGVEAGKAPEGLHFFSPDEQHRACVSIEADRARGPAASGRKRRDEPGAAPSD